MTRRNILKSLAAFSTLAWLSSSQAANNTTRSSTPVNDVIKPLVKSKADWKAILPAAAYAVLFEEGTERPNSSPLNEVHQDGTFICAACNLPLFNSKAKFDSGTGWPSFSFPIEGRIGTSTDYKLVWPRTEYHCARCGGHQGHVFDDGPKPTGQRYCNNGVALQFVQKGNALPTLRS